MKNNILKNKLTKPLVFDGAMGTMLLSAGLTLRECPELWNVTRPSVITEIHKKYIQAGSDVVQTNTFGANRIKLSNFGLSDKVYEINSSAVLNAKKAAQNNALVALDIGPTGQLLYPWGELDFDEAVDVFKEQINAGISQGPDLIIIETMTQLAEARAALLAAKSLTDIPVIVTMSFESNARTTLGTSPETAALVLSSMGADVVGVNCVGDYDLVAEIVNRMAAISGCPIIAQPNAGIPELIDGKSIYTTTPDFFSKNCVKIVNAGASIIGGCCGTTPEHLKALSKIVKQLTPSSVKERTTPAVSTNFDVIPLDPKGPTIIVGERINPTGKKTLKTQLKDGDYTGVIQLAKTQVRQGAKILDVNVGIPGEDEPLLMKKAVTEIQKSVKVGLCIDSGNIDALEAGLKTFHGRAIINSVNGNDKSLHTVLPLAKKYGAMVIGLAMDDKGIETTACERLEIAKKIIKTAAEYGIPSCDIIIDGLTLTAGAQQELVMETINTVKLVREKLGCLTTLGVSNVSFGIPNRPLINRTFLAMALAAGLNMPIIDPGQDYIAETIAAADLLTGKDAGGRHLIKFLQEVEKKKTYFKPEQGIQTAKSKLTSETDFTADTQQAGDAEQTINLYQSIIEGNTEDAKNQVEILLNNNMEPLEIINKYITPALNEAGIKFEAGEFYLPQLLLTAEAAQGAFSIIKKRLSTRSIKSLGKIILATVQGDIHDIGKNIVKVLLENHGFTVIDLGKDVPPEKIVETVTDETKLVGLSALMTTTVPSMEKTIKLLRQKGYKDRIMVGGAVITPDLAQRIGADYYAKDAMEGVKIARKVYDHS